MARKLIFGDFTATHTLTMYKDTETLEYVARVVCKHTHEQVAEYFSDDRADAKATGLLELHRATELGVTHAA